MQLTTVLRAIGYYIPLIIYTCIYSLLTDFLFILIKPFNFTPTTINTICHYIKYSYAQMTILLLTLCGVTFHMDDVIKSDRALWISNHRSKLDGLILQSVLYANGAPNIAIVKKSISYLPFFGSFGRNMDSIFIDRDSTSIDCLINSATKSCTLKNSILLFPEGATLSPDSKGRSDKFAMENDLEVLHNVLIPKTTGFDIVKSHGKFNVVGDLTLRYENPSIPGYCEHSYLDLLTLFPRDIYITVRYHQADELDLYKGFVYKNNILGKNLIAENFYVGCKKSIILMAFNICLLGGFIYGLFSSTFRWATLVLSVYTISRVFVRS